jgi:hypothetical protein
VDNQIELSLSGDFGCVDITELFNISPTFTIEAASVQAYTEASTKATIISNLQ